MQRPDPRKRRHILATAAQLFASRPYHEVTLDAVATAAKVGKGTLYVYFDGKEQLYGALLDEGFGELVADLQRQLARPGHALDQLATIVRALLAHAQRFPHLFHLMRAGRQLPCATQLADHRETLMQLVRDVVRRGVRRRELRDARPELTAAYVPALVRAAVLYGPADVTPSQVADHVLAVLAHGIAGTAGRRPPRAGGSSGGTRSRSRSRSRSRTTAPRARR